MTSPGVTAPTSKRPSESGLDTSNGLQFVKQRIGMFAKIIALIGLAFLIVGIVAGLALKLTDPPMIPVQTVGSNTLPTFIAHIGGSSCVMW